MPKVTIPLHRNMVSAKGIKFKINSLSYEMLGQVFDNDYGVICSFKLLDCLDLEYDSEKWD